MRGNMTDEEVLQHANDLDRAYASAAAYDEAGNTGHVRFDYRLWPDDLTKWAEEAPQVFKMLQSCITDGELQENGGYYTVTTSPLRSRLSGEVVFSADATGLVADVSFRCNWSETRTVAWDLASVSGLWDLNEDDGPPEGDIEKLIVALIERFPGSSEQFLNAPRIAVRLGFGDDPDIAAVFSKINSLDYELCEREFSAWSYAKSFAKSFLSNLHT